MIELAIERLGHNNPPLKHVVIFLISIAITVLAFFAWLGLFKIFMYLDNL